MNNEQKQRALQMLRRFERAVPKTRQADNAAVAMAALLQELIEQPTSVPEPAAKVLHVDGLLSDNLIDCDLPVGTLLYTAPVPALLVRDAERYRWLRTYNTAKHPDVTEAFFLGDENLDAEIDAAISAEKDGA